MAPRVVGATKVFHFTTRAASAGVYIYVAAGGLWRELLGAAPQASSRTCSLLVVLKGYRCPKTQAQGVSWSEKGVYEYRDRTIQSLGPQ